jgi:glucokinase
MIGRRIVADAGGTNLRFAITTETNAGLRDLRCYRRSEFRSFLAALEKFVGDTACQGSCSGIAIGVAGPVDDGVAQMTTGNWCISEAEASAALGGCPARIVNDVEAVALALPTLQLADYVQIGPIEKPSQQQRVMLAINVGTGFGAAALVPSKSGWVSLSGEPGHMNFGNLDQTSGTPPSSSVESILSGAGVAALFSRLGHTSPATSAMKEFGRTDGRLKHPLVLRFFTEVLGDVAGNLTLATGAWGGVFFCGGVIHAWKEQADHDRFRTRFESKGAMTTRMRRVFTGVITKPNIALFGLAGLSL